MSPSSLIASMALGLGFFPLRPSGSRGLTPSRPDLDEALADNRQLICERPYAAEDDRIHACIRHGPARPEAVPSETGGETGAPYWKAM